MRIRANANLAETITRAASRQTYYTIRFLTDAHRRDAALRAYAYFRWVDDVLDGCASRHGWAFGAGVEDRLAFLERQASLLDRCRHGEEPSDATAHEAMLVELVRGADLDEWGLEAYLRNMMQVMQFDVGRRGRLITGVELDTYSGWLATAVIGAMQYFIGSDPNAPQDPGGYRAVTGAHILHMLRDTSEDLAAGYFNVPREMLVAHGIRPTDIYSDAYRQWVAIRVGQAAADLDAGSAYFSGIANRRHRLAGLAYIGRFRWLIAAITRDEFFLRPNYDGRHRLRTTLGLARDVAVNTFSRSAGADRSLASRPPQ